MDCKHCRKLLHEYLDGALSFRLRASVEEHLQVCDECGEALAQERDFSRAVSGLLRRKTESLRLSRDVQRYVTEALESGARSPKIRRGYSRVLLRPVLAVAAAAAGQSVSRSAGRPAATSAAGSEIEKIEMRRAPGHAARTTTVGKPVTFKLLDVRTQAVYGPFELRDEARVTLDDKQYVLLMVEKTEAKAKLQERLRRTVLKSLELKEARFQEVVEFLARASCEDDPNGAPLNIVVAPAQLVERLPTITINLRNIPLYDAIRYVTEVAAVTFRVDDHAVVITVQ